MKNSHFPHANVSTKRWETWKSLTFFPSSRSRELLTHFMENWINFPNREKCGRKNDDLHHFPSPQPKVKSTSTCTWNFPLREESLNAQLRSTAMTFLKITRRKMEIVVICRWCSWHKTEHDAVAVEESSITIKTYNHLVSQKVYSAARSSVNKIKFCCQTLFILWIKFRMLLLLANVTLGVSAISLVVLQTRVKYLLNNLQFWVN